MCRYPIRTLLFTTINYICASWNNYAVIVYIHVFDFGAAFCNNASVISLYLELLAPQKKGAVIDMAYFSFHSPISGPDHTW